MIDNQVLLTTAVGLALMLAIMQGVLLTAGVNIGWRGVTATLRAIIQLGIASLILSGVLSVGWTVLLVLVFMATTASLTSRSRLGNMPGANSAVWLGVITGAWSMIAIVFATGMLDTDPRNVIAIGGIVTGNAMSAATLTGRNFRLAAEHRRGEIEAWWSLGATSPVAYRSVAQQAVFDALVPSIDQTRSTGMVTLPGAFIGALFGGASPLEAARFQVIVLVAIIASQAVTARIVVWRLANSPVLPLAATKK
ncbi:ABC transporter permease [Dermabacteraceae bacterium P13095]